VYKIEAIIRPERLYDVKQALKGQGQEDFVVTDVRDCGSSTRHPATWRGIEYEVEFTRQLRVDLQATDDAVDPIVEAIVGAAYTGRPDDGTIVATPISEVLDIRDAGRSSGRPVLRSA